MTRLWNDPADFADEMIDGFVAAHARYVRRVTGGVVRAAGTTPGRVAVVVGGGSGHYPAFGGLVGPGLAHGAAMGNLFASPSAQQVHAVASAAHAGGGVFFAYGNYAGDVLNFDAAQERLRGEGIACATVAVTDDIMSAAPAERHRRRGIAGDLAAFRIAGAAAEAGYDLDGVARVAALANERTRSFGVAFSGCSLPGADAPLFSVPPGRMAVGLGIHGEPGVAETDIPTADGLAALLVDALLGEIPDGVEASGARVVPILNGLGSLAHEEMFVVYRRVAHLLAAAGVEVIDPHVGDYCTSFDMAGTSLTLLWLDDELAALWDSPVDTPVVSYTPLDVCKRQDVPWGGDGGGRVRVGYFGFNRPRFRHVILGDGTWRVEVIDTWNMTIEEIPGHHTGQLRVELPGRPYIAVRLTRTDPRPRRPG
ncbi:dihydroxyacetone kinase subunit DhaK, partial [Microbacterium hominis]|uniref:dihydroxyacetone kinase subunit DhaK n=1 Tax=Microbacterium hominis TaxID=162426 RepID=UPI000A67F6B3